MKHSGVSIMVRTCFFFWEGQINWSADGKIKGTSDLKIDIDRSSPSKMTKLLISLDVLSWWRHTPIDYLFTKKVRM